VSPGEEEAMGVMGAVVRVDVEALDRRVRLTKGFAEV
jgi:hypothetical protein